MSVSGAEVRSFSAKFYLYFHSSFLQKVSTIFLKLYKLDDREPGKRWHCQMSAQVMKRS